MHSDLKVTVNYVDQTLAVDICSWVLSEFIRLSHNAGMETARSMIEGLASDRAPITDISKGRRLLLSQDLDKSEEILIHLHLAKDWVSVEDLSDWIPDADRNLVQTNLRNLRDRRHVYYNGNQGKITPLGAEKAERIIRQHFEDN